MTGRLWWPSPIHREIEVTDMTELELRRWCLRQASDNLGINRTDTATLILTAERLYQYLITGKDES